MLHGPSQLAEMVADGKIGTKLLPKNTKNTHDHLLLRNTGNKLPVPPAGCGH
jgi:hypothetical protein